jgi:hypothetical protein
LGIIQVSPSPAAWGVFWSLYFLCAKDITDFVADYTEAWRLQPGVDAALVIFVDNGHRLLVTRSSAINDKALMKHLHIFYDLIRTGGGVLELLGARPSQRIDIVELSLGFCFFLELRD